MADDIVIPPGAVGELQQFVYGLLAADAFFADIPVLIERKKEINYEIDRAMKALQGQGGAIGIFCVVATPKLTVTYPNMPGPVFDDVDLYVRTIEDVTSNQSPGGTMKQAADVSKKVSELLHQKSKPDLCQPFLCKYSQAVADPDYSANVVYDAVFKTGLKK